MKNSIRTLTVLLICTSLLASFDMGGVKRPFGKPRGSFIGSCKGVMEMLPGGKRWFLFDLFKTPDGDLKNIFQPLE